jgi:cobalamin biosynthesis Mg chelatase CobN
MLQTKKGPAVSNGKAKVVAKAAPKVQARAPKRRVMEAPSTASVTARKESPERRRARAVQPGEDEGDDEAYGFGAPRANGGPKFVVTDKTKKASSPRAQESEGMSIGPWLGALCAVYTFGSMLRCVLKCC